MAADPVQISADVSIFFLLGVAAVLAVLFAAAVTLVVWLVMRNRSPSAAQHGATRHCPHCGGPLA